MSKFDGYAGYILTSDCYLLIGYHSYYRIHAKLYFYIKQAVMELKVSRYFDKN